MTGSGFSSGGAEEKNMSSIVRSCWMLRACSCSSCCQLVLLVNVTGVSLCGWEDDEDAGREETGYMLVKLGFLVRGEWGSSSRLRFGRLGGSGSGVGG